MKTAVCPSCELIKRSAAINPDGLCDECRGGSVRKLDRETVERIRNTSEAELALDGAVGAMMSDIDVDVLMADFKETGKVSVSDTLALLEACKTLLEIDQAIRECCRTTPRDGDSIRALNMQWDDACSRARAAIAKAEAK